MDTQNTIITFRTEYYGFIDRCELCVTQIASKYSFFWKLWSGKPNSHTIAHSLLCNWTFQKSLLFPKYWKSQSDVGSRKTIHTVKTCLAIFGVGKTFYSESIWLIGSRDEDRESCLPQVSLVWFISNDFWDHLNQLLFACGILKSVGRSLWGTTLLLAPSMTEEKAIDIMHK